MILDDLALVPRESNGKHPRMHLFEVQMWIDVAVGMWNDYGCGVNGWEGLVLANAILLAKINSLVIR